MNVRKHAAVTKAMTFFGLFLLMLTTGACKKEVTQVVDQGYSAVYKIHASDFSASNGGENYTTQLSVPEVDQQIVANGGVMVYISLDGGDTYEAMPEVFDNVAYGTYHQVGKVFVDMSNPGGSGAIPAPVDPTVGYFLIKVVILDATALPS